MRVSGPRRKPSKGFLAIAAVTLTAAAMPLGAASSTTNGYPTTIAAIGDSITAAACTDSTCADLPANSWATGTNASVQSQLVRIRKVVKDRHSVGAENLATSANVTMADFAAQAADAIAAHATFVTVELGENDLCEGTSLGRFDREVNTGLRVLTRGGRGVKILVLSIEDLVRHWRVLRSDPRSAAAFKAGAGIDCGLGYTATRARLADVQARTRSLNRILAKDCGHVNGCRYDGGAYYRLPVTALDFSPADYQHLSIEGQRALSAAEWRAVIRTPTLLLS
jgi:lysophospholipase L1-like esterase